MILAPFFLGVVYIGDLLFVLFIAVLMAAMSYEWRQLCNVGKFDFTGIFCVFATFITVMSSHFFDVLIVVILMVLWIGLLVLLSRLNTSIKGRFQNWMLMGMLLIGSTGIGLVWLREINGRGLEIVFWLICTIWTTDIFAFLFGRSLKGPKLAPSISPNKTWSGLLSGVSCAALLGFLWSYGIADSKNWLILPILGGGTALLAQLGDLSVSKVKRRFGVKDSGKLIPGHGGLLDRMDGFLGAVPFFALSLAVSKGDVSPWL